MIFNRVVTSYLGTTRNPTEVPIFVGLGRENFKKLHGPKIYLELTELQNFHFLLEIWIARMAIRERKR